MLILIKFANSKLISRRLTESAITYAFFLKNKPMQKTQFKELSFTVLFFLSPQNSSQIQYNFSCYITLFLLTKSARASYSYRKLKGVLDKVIYNHSHKWDYSFYFPIQSLSPFSPPSFLYQKSSVCFFFFSNTGKHKVWPCSGLSKRMWISPSS